MCIRLCETSQYCDFPPPFQLTWELAAKISFRRRQTVVARTPFTGSKYCRAKGSCEGKLIVYSEKYQTRTLLCSHRAIPLPFHHEATAIRSLPSLRPVAIAYLDVTIPPLSYPNAQQIFSTSFFCTFVTSS